jgi:hypothetical protein
MASSRDDILECFVENIFSAIRSRVQVDSRGMEQTKNRGLTSPLTHLSYFDGAFPFCSLGGSKALGHLAGDDIFFFNPEIMRPVDLDSVDVSTVHDMTEEDTHIPTFWTKLGITRIRKAGPDRLRRAGVPFAPNAIEHVTAALVGLSGYVVARTFWGGGSTFKTWNELKTANLPSLDKDTSLRAMQMIKVAYSEAFTAQMCWTVDLALPDMPSIRFITSSGGAKEIFRLRDIPDGKKRRTAILHWVKEHWRKNNSVTRKDMLALVRRHLNGSNTFTWNGLRCTILPSDDDIKYLRRESLWAPVKPTQAKEVQTEV